MFKFTIRELLLLTLSVALALGWYLRERHLEVECERQVMVEADKAQRWKDALAVTELALWGDGWKCEWLEGGIRFSKDIRRSNFGDAPKAVVSHYYGTFEPSTELPP